MKCAFFYACGTGFIINDVNGFSVDLNGRLRWKDTLLIGEPGVSGMVPGINGRSALWDLGTPSADPFPTLLDPDVWVAESINYPASFIGGTGVFGTSMGGSINYGIDKMITAIKRLPSGMPFAIGGYSQGAAVASGVYLAGLQDGTTGPLESYRDRFLGGVCFGNPRRQRDFLGPFGVWTGAWDDPGSNTGGGGAFPATGQWKRLTGCEPDKWCEFTAPDDIFSSVGTTELGAGFTVAIDVFLDLSRSGIINYIFDGLVDDALAGANAAMFAEDAVGKQPFYQISGDGQFVDIAGAGHVTYPLMPPCDLDGTWTSSTSIVEGPDGNDYLKAEQDSCYQLALKWLEGKAAERANASIILPSTPETTRGAGWSSVLLTPT